MRRELWNTLHTTALPTCRPARSGRSPALIRGRPGDEALELLRFLPNKSARLLEAGPEERAGQRRGPRRPRHRRSGRHRVARRWRADHEADPAAGPRHRLSDQAPLWPISTLTLSDLEEEAARVQELSSQAVQPKLARGLLLFEDDQTMGQKVRPTGFRTGIMIATG